MAESLLRSDWIARRDAHLERVRPWVEDRLRRMACREKHPVHDFLFEYYSFRPAHLQRWSPGVGVRLQQATRGELPWNEFTEDADGLILSAASFPTQRLGYLTWATAYLEAVADREPMFACLGLHEWAMVYRDPNVRHSYVPLRLRRDGTDAFVDTQTLRCTHYDAFRFFTPEAVPRNRLTLTRAGTTEHDQPGCVHVTMDLYRFAYKIAPFVPGELMADAFELAAQARELDMRASPYDLSAFGYTPITIETREGRDAYVAAQRLLSEWARPIRARLLAVYRDLQAAVTPAASRDEGK